MSGGTQDSGRDFKGERKSWGSQEANRDAADSGRERGAAEIES